MLKKNVAGATTRVINEVFIGLKNEISFLMGE